MSRKISLCEHGFLPRLNNHDRWIYPRLVYMQFGGPRGERRARSLRAAKLNHTARIFSEPGVVNFWRYQPGTSDTTELRDLTVRQRLELEEVV